jgi:hypothetical protein
MYTPDSHKDDPARIVRAEPRAMQARVRESRKARAQSLSRSVAFTCGGTHSKGRSRCTHL